MTEKHDAKAVIDHNKELLTILSTDDKHTIFRQAYLTSNQLIAWNVPVRLNSISDKRLKNEARERLFKKNVLDNLIILYLGDSAWIKGEYEKLTDEQARNIAQTTAGQYLFITKLEKNTGKDGELKKILKEHQNKDMKELREKWEVSAEEIKDIKEWANEQREKHANSK